MSITCNAFHWRCTNAYSSCLSFCAMAFQTFSKCRIRSGTSGTKNVAWVGTPPFAMSPDSFHSRFRSVHCHEVHVRIRQRCPCLEPESFIEVSQQQRHQVAVRYNHRAPSLQSEYLVERCNGSLHRLTTRFATIKSQFKVGERLLQTVQPVVHGFGTQDSLRKSLIQLHVQIRPFCKGFDTLYGSHEWA